MAHPVDLVKEQADRSDSFFRGIPLPAVNESGGWNQTLADELRGEFDWMSVTSWDLRVTLERGIASKGDERKKGAPAGDSGEARDEDEGLVALAPTWAWVRGGITVGAPNTTLEYKFYGLHHIANGTYELFSLHESQRVDIRHIPTLYPDHHNETAQIVLDELKKELQIQEDSLLLTDVKPEGERLHSGLGSERANVRTLCDQVPTTCPPLCPSAPTRRAARGRTAVR